MKKISPYNVLPFLILIFSVAHSQTDVLTQHNDAARTGWNNQETSLNTSNVNTSSFGLLYTRAVDDQVFAQPLVVSGVNIPTKGTKNVVYICTVNNTIYAFDADDGTANAYWQINFTPSGYRAPLRTDMYPGLCGGTYHDFTGNIGLVGTPVIDKAANTMYFVTKIVSTSPGVVDNHAWNGNEYSYTSDGFHQYLHAIDLGTGADKVPPVEIIATASGTGDGSASGTITFDPRRHFNRAGLVLSNGIVYIAYAAHCDWNPAHGWLLGYNSTTLQQQLVYVTTPNDGRGGIWMSGAAPAVDASGSLYFTSGNAYDDENGFTDDPSSPANRGESVIKVTPNTLDNTATTLNLTSYYTPHNYKALNDADLDFPIQILLIPNSNMLVTGNKDNNLYTFKQSALGGFSTTTDNYLQKIYVGSSNAQMHSSLAYFGGAANQYVYQLSENTLLQSFQVTGTTSLSTTGVSSPISGPTGSSGGFMSVSSNGSDASTGILWVSQSINGCNANAQSCQGILRAVRADDVTKELWNSSMNANDNFGYFSKMNCPTIANGKVYLNTFSNQVAVFGLETVNTSCITNVALNKSATASSTQSSSYMPAYAFDGDMTSRWSSLSTDNQYIYVDLGAEYDICRVNIYWETALGKNFTIDVSDDAITWTTIQTFTNNTSMMNTASGTFQGRYVRMNGTKRGTTFGYSIYEMQVFGQLSAACNAPANLGSSNITENGATISWQAVSGATSYNVQYKTSIVSSWITRTTTSTTLNLSALSCGTGYTYQVQAVCPAGTSAQSTGTFITSNCTAICGPLPTRYNSADIGDIGFAGSSCLDNGIYTIQGSGSIVNSSDAFQYAFTSLSGDEHVYAEVLSQDAASPADQAGIMFRDSVSNTARFAFIGTTNANGVVFEYRSTPGGPVTTVTVPGISAPYWISLNKTGTSYTAYISPTGIAGSWVQVGSTTDLGFGNSTSYVGLAVTSENNAALSTVTIGNYVESSLPLPVKLISFDASNINNQYISLKWSTSSEINSSYFDVQRSADGVTYSNIARVSAAENSSLVQYYSSIDYHPENGYNFYRLSMVDLDGAVSYSPIVRIKFGTQNPPQVFPNPANSYFTVTAGDEPFTEISVMDVSGKTIQRITNSNGATFVTIESANLSSGIYIVQITTASSVYQKKLFKE